MTRDEKAAIAREQSRRIASDSTLRRRLAMADHGRDLVWVIEWNGVAVALLADPKPKREHWRSYDILPYALDPDTLRFIQSAGFWLQQSLVFRNTELNLVATHAFAAGEGPSEGRILIYGLYFDLELSLLDRLHLMWRRFRA